MLKLSVDAQHQKCSGGPKEYEDKFIARFEKYQKLPGYHYIEDFAQQCIDLHCGDNLNGISARTYMDRVAMMPEDAFASWLKKYIAKALWAEFGDIPVDESGELLDEDWTIETGLIQDGTDQYLTTTFEKGTEREYVWMWFEETFDVSVAEDLMGLEDEPASI